MKKLKIMLLSLALFAVVGGALAFKAKFQTAYCTAPVQNVSGNVCLTTCPDRTISTTEGASESPFICTTAPQAGKCDINGTPLDCNTSLKLIKDF